MPSVSITSSLHSLGSRSRGFLRRKDKDVDEHSTATESTSRMTGFSLDGRRPRPRFPKNVSRRGRLSHPPSTRSVNKKRVDSLWDSHSGLPLGSSSCCSRGSSKKASSTCSHNRRRSHNSQTKINAFVQQPSEDMQRATPATAVSSNNRAHAMRVSDLTTEPLQELPEAQPIEEEEEEVLEEEEVPEYLHASELGVCVDENGLPNFLDMVIEIPSSDLPMVIEIPAGGQTEEDCDSDDEDDLKPSRVWDVVSTADAESAAVSMDRDSHGVGTATVDDDDDEEEDSFAEAGEKEEIHNKVRNLASMLRKKSAVHVSKSERRVR